ncbi:hypothetical protein Poli38472_000592 [Pythium oligandrum]|uniref:Uncharacterized protein n=1 Tax=Pythium oligandrum TaxID=41045 RepID=A0A8K1CCE5_PYTOL|nr:hypothetical protein Poli38472_000592 [Pythium oligandrum]|eukprot:TMW60550.1 hypothetical protein Poli38472_000592 [Pythium oligandrum]
MWTKFSSSVLLLALLAARSTAQNVAVNLAASSPAASSTSSSGAQTNSANAKRDVLITMPIAIDGTTRNLQLLRGESYEDAAISFAQSVGILQHADEIRVREVVGQLSGLLKGKMEEIEAEEAAAAAAAVPQQVLQLTLPLTINGFNSELKKYEGESVEAAVERYLYASGYTMEVMRELYPQIITLVNNKLEELQPPSKELFAFTLTIDGREVVTRHFENGDPMEEAQMTLRSIGVQDAELINRLAPQIAKEISRRIAGLGVQPTQEQEPQQVQQQAPVAQELFSIPLTMNNRPALLVHYEGFTSRESAMRFLEENSVNDANSMNQFVPQLVQLIDNRIAELANQEAQTQPQLQEQEPPVQPPHQVSALKELFSIPLTMNDRAVVLVHYDGLTSRESASRFLSENGVTDANAFNQYLPQLIQVIDTRIAEIVKQETEQAAAAAAAAVEREAEARRAQRVPMVRLPISLGNGHEATLEYFDGDSVERTVELFLSHIGLQEGPDFVANTQRLSELVRREVKTVIEQQAPAQETAPVQPPQALRPQPLLTLPITIGGRVFNLEYFAGQEPAYVANTFCVEKYEIVRAELGLQFDGNQLVECKNVLESTIRTQADLPQQQQQEPVREEPPQRTEPQQPQASPNSRGDHLFTVDVDIDKETTVQLRVYQDDDPEQVARAFCHEHRIDLANIPALVDAIRDQLASLN